MPIGAVCDFGQSLVNVGKELCEILDNPEYLTALSSSGRGIGESVSIVNFTGEVTVLSCSEFGELANQLLPLSIQRCYGAIDLHDNPSGSTAGDPIGHADAKLRKPHTDVEGTPSCTSV